ncbi:hypothetical protein ATY41_07250 [Leifsonia xyli subsp. xyli]|uniref:GtrA/DPMS transmembrane domain-containing protein n=2 Tax=Leifsonia xyli subsp. xyli TaxID=59736 RepID=A0A1E2SMG0_LEIXY|nr:GtrA family protein [Leifsonia xyli]ODA91016.1 hypothetical protein ATY41_07250 [Leifsonia xyli subsp. xyli]
MTIQKTIPARTARLLPQLIKFGAVGAVGLAVNLVVFNAMLLIVLRGVPHATVLSTVIATTAAIFANWAGNRFWAFSGQRQRNALREGAEFFTVSLAGMGIPLLCIGVSHYLLGLTSPIADNISANGIGLALGMLFRFAFYRWWVFSPARGQRPPASALEPVAAAMLTRTPDRGLVGD